ncbi:hypothetical protein JUNP479_1222 [Aeromonas jandaei]|nr:hypothetical protein JUNP479_1222 [Aeromonas jandaei]
MLKTLVTGGAGFIGSAVVRHIIRDTQDAVINLDKLTYAGNLESLADVSSSERYAFEQVDICNRAELDRVFALHQPDEVAAGEPLPLFTETTPYAPSSPYLPPRFPATIWYAPGAVLTACRPSSPTAPTTTALITSPRS